MARTLDNETLIALSNDPRALEPNTIRQVIREAGLDAAHAVEDLEFFLDCVSTRKLVEQGEMARATLCATQLGTTLDAFFPPTSEGTHMEHEERNVGAALHPSPYAGRTATSLKRLSVTDYRSRVLKAWASQLDAQGEGNHILMNETLLGFPQILTVRAPNGQVYIVCP